MAGVTIIDESDDDVVKGIQLRKFLLEGRELDLFDDGESIPFEKVDDTLGVVKIVLSDYVEYKRVMDTDKIQIPGKTVWSVNMVT